MLRRTYWTPRTRREGNRNQQQATHGTPPTTSASITPASNRVAGYTYDAAGNVIDDGTTTFVYDAAGRLVSATDKTTQQVTSYVYDADGFRIKTISPTETVTYIRSGANVVAEYDGTPVVASPDREHVYFGGTLAATHDHAAQDLQYHHWDHLSMRLSTDDTGAVVNRQGHYPYGEQWYRTGTSPRLFTTYERESESRPEYAMMRQHEFGLGRFTSPDPVRGTVADPQSWNRYAYVGSDPVNLVDPLGLHPLDIGHQHVTVTEKAPPRPPKLYWPTEIDARALFKQAWADVEAFISGLRIGARERFRPAGPIYITGHSIGCSKLGAPIGPYHLALEHQTDSKTNWISAGPNGGWLGGFAGGTLVSGVGVDERPTDAPNQNTVLGMVFPPPGMTTTEYFDQLVQADAVYRDNLPYGAVPSLVGGYNSNGYVFGLIFATGGTPSTVPSEFVGGNQPVPTCGFK